MIFRWILLIFSFTEVCWAQDIEFRASANPVTLGQDVLLTCSSDPPPVQYWIYREDYEYMALDKPLQVNNIQEEDLGRYVCWLKWEVEMSSQVNGRISQHAFLNISALRKPRQVSISFRQTTASRFTANEGNIVELRCQSPDFAEFYTFSLNGQMVRSRMPVARYSFMAEERHEGRYTCSAENSAGSTNSNNTLQLHVTGPPDSIDLQLSANSVVIGELVTMTCIYTGSDVTETPNRWSFYHTGRVLAERQASDTFTVHSATMASSGMYTCRGYNQAGSKVSPERQLTVRAPDPPTGVILLMPDGDNIKVGRRFKLICSVNNEESISWFRYYVNNRLVEQINSPMYIVVEADESLHEGDWTCEAGNQWGSAKSEPKHLDILAAPRGVSITTSTTAIFGSEIARLTCLFDPSGDTPLRFYFFKNGIRFREVPAIPGNPSAEILISARNESLVPGEEYRFECEGVNDCGSTRSQEPAVVRVLAPPSVTLLLSPDQNLVCSGSFSLTCDVTSHPNSPFTFTSDTFFVFLRNRRVITTPQKEATLQLIAEEATQGSYQCILTNRHFRAESNLKRVSVISKPTTVSITTTHTRTFLGSNVRLECLYEPRDLSEDRPAHFRFFRNSMLVRNSTQSIITLSNLRSQDAGEYTCEAVNLCHGTHSCNSVQLAVIGAPRSVSTSWGATSDITVTRGDRATLRCRYDMSGDHATSFSFYKENRLISSQNLPYHVIESVTSSDAGRYYCSAQNDAGTTNSTNTATLTIRDISGAPRIEVLTPVVKEGSTIRMTCHANSVTYRRDSRSTPEYLFYRGESLVSVMKTPEFTVTSARKDEHQGEYRCEMRTPDFSLASLNSQHVDVIGRLGGVRVRLDKQVVPRHSEVKVDCIFKIPDDPRDRPTHFLFRSNAGIFNSTTARYVIPNVTRAHEGRYSCDVGNPYFVTPSINAEYLNIIEPPRDVRITITDSFVSKGATVQLTCSFNEYDSKPTGFRFLRNSVDLGTSVSPHYIIYSARAEDSGNYSCLAINDGGQTHSVNYQRLQVVDTTTAVTISITQPVVKQGFPVSLSCQTEIVRDRTNGFFGTTSHNVVHYLFYRNEELIAEETSPTMTIPETNRQRHEGQYTCEIHSRGSTVASHNSVNLNVITPLEGVHISLSPYIALVGGTVQAECSHRPITNPNDSPKHFLFYSGSRLVANSTTSVHLIRDIQKEHAGKYTCTAVNAAFSVPSDNHQVLDVIAAPSDVYIELESSPVRVGEMVQLSCRFSPTDPATAFTFYHNKQPIGTTTRPYMELNSVSQQQEGEYSCSAANDAGTTHSRNTRPLVVVGEPTAPILSIRPPIVKEGSATVLSCDVDTRSADASVWFRSSPLLYTFLHEDMFIAESSRGSHLISAAEKTRHQGRWSCQVRAGTTKPLTSNTAVLSVIAKVESVYIRVERNRVPVGGSVRVDCEFELPTDAADWPTHFVFMRNGQIIQNQTESSWTRSSVQMMDQGRYTCEAGNPWFTQKSYNEETIEIIEPPRLVSVSITKPVVPLGASVSLSCSYDIQSAHATSFEFYQNDRFVHSSETPIYHINRAQLTSEGEFMCFAMNEAGKTQSSNTVHLTVFTPPTQPQVKLYPNIVKEGARATITCSLPDTQTPRPEVEQYLQSLDITYMFYQDETLVHESSSRTMLIENTDESEHEGRYRCAARTPDWMSEGAHSEVLHIVSRIADDVYVRSSAVNAVLNERVSISCEYRREGSVEDWPTHFLFYRDNMLLKNMTTNMYDFLVDTQTHSGTYTCEVGNTCFTTKSCNSVELSVVERPDFPVVALDPRDTLLGDIVKVECKHSQPDTVAQYIFHHNGSIAEHSALPFFYMPIDSFRLAGIYWCAVHNSAGERLSTNNETLFIHPPASGVRVQVQPDLVPEGNTSVISCKWDNSGDTRAVNVDFYLNGAHVSTVGSEGRYVIPRVSMTQHAGWWRCKVNSLGGSRYSSNVQRLSVIGGPSRVTIIVDPENPPIIDRTISPDTVLEGERVVITCDAFPLQNIRSYDFYRNDILYPNPAGTGSHQLIIEQAFVKQHEGDWKCRARSASGSLTSDVGHLNVLTGPSKVELIMDVNPVDMCSPVTFTCLAHDLLDEYMSITFTNGLYRLNVTRPGTSVTVPSVEVLHGGNWYCTYRGAWGEVRSDSIKLDTRDIGVTFKTGCDDRSYYFDRCPRTYEEARRSCINKDMSLAVLGSREEIDWVNEELDKLNEDPFLRGGIWIEGSKAFTSEFQNGLCSTPLRFTQFSRMITSGDCLTLQNQFMQQRNCQDKSYFLCHSNDPAWREAQRQNDPTTCDEVFYGKIMDKTYTVIRRNMTRDNAEGYCRGLQMKLLTLNSARELTALNQMLQTKGADNVAVWTSPRQDRSGVFRDSCSNPVPSDLLNNYWMRGSVTSEPMCSVLQQYKQRETSCDQCTWFICEEDGPCPSPEPPLQPPVIRLQPAVSVYVGDNVQLICDVTSSGLSADEISSYEFYRGTRLVKTSSTAAMTMFSVQLSDAGTFHCLYRTPNRQSNISNTVTLTITGPPKNVRAEFTPETITLCTTRDTMTVRCVADDTTHVDRYTFHSTDTSGRDTMFEVRAPRNSLPINSTDLYGLQAAPNTQLHCRAWAGQRYTSSTPIKASSLFKNGVFELRSPCGRSYIYTTCKFTYSEALAYCDTVNYTLFSPVDTSEVMDVHRAARRIDPDVWRIRTGLRRSLNSEWMKAGCTEPTLYRAVFSQTPQDTTGVMTDRGLVAVSPFTQLPAVCIPANDACDIAFDVTSTDGRRYVAIKRNKDRAQAGKLCGDYGMIPLTIPDLPIMQLVCNPISDFGFYNETFWLGPRLQRNGQYVDSCGASTPQEMQDMAWVGDHGRQCMGLYQDKFTSLDCDECHYVICTDDTSFSSDCEWSNL